MKKIEIEYVGTDTIFPYENNPRLNDQAVDAVANSIKEFGFKVPIVVDKQNVIITGHTRLKAAQKLGLKTVPIIRAEDLTKKQVKAFRIADNSTGELAQWDIDALQIELGDISFDMSDFGLHLDLPVIENDYGFDLNEGGYYGDERERTQNPTLFQYYDEHRTEGIYDMPMLEPVDYIPKRMVGFNYAKTATDKDVCIHFYLDDYQFERIWNRPMDYLPLLSSFDSCLTPNFSIYYDMPKAIRIWNTYRSRLLGQMMQDYGITTIPIVYFGNEQSWDYCFDGIPENSTVSINNIGNSNKDSKERWDIGCRELLRRKHPTRILLYGNGMKEDFDFGDTEVIYYENEVTKRWKDDSINE